MMNSLYGKFGQRGRRFEIVDECDPNDVSTWSQIDADTKEITHWRSFGGIVQQWIDEGEGRESFCGIASYVTSFARLKLWNAIDLAGRDNCYYCDTDSLVINSAGYERVKHLMDPDKLGWWKLESIFKSLVLNGPKDYIFDDTKKVKGIRKNAIWHTDSIASQDYFVGLKGLIRSNNLANPVVYPITKVNARRYTKGVIDDDFNVLPLRLDS